jgi:hypothetical protein
MLYYAVKVNKMSFSFAPYYYYYFTGALSAQGLSGMAS